MLHAQDGKTAIDKAKVEVVRTLLVDATNAFEVRTPCLPFLPFLAFIMQYSTVQSNSLCYWAILYSVSDSVFHSFFLFSFFFSSTLSFFLSIFFFFFLFLSFHSLILPFICIYHMCHNITHFSHTTTPPYFLFKQICYMNKERRTLLVPLWSFII